MPAEAANIAYAIPVFPEEASRSRLLRKAPDTTAS
jgi:hypothetical protein